MNNAILVPTDFSSNALVASKYAAFIATKFNCELRLLHVYTAYTRAMATPEFNEQLEAHAEKRAGQSMQQLRDQLRSLYPHLHITTACVRGRLTSEVLKIVSTGVIRFVIMGSTGASRLRNVAIGSNTFELIQQCPIGVLAVPDGYDNTKMGRLGMLTNFKESELALLDAFIARTTTALEVYLLHVSEAGKTPSDVDIEFWKDVVYRRSDVKRVLFKWEEAAKRLDTADSIPNCIDKMILQNELDLLLVSYNRKSFFRQLFSKSLTKAIVKGLSIPTYFKRDDV